MKPERLVVRPCYHSDELLIEIRGDHRVEGFPPVAEILRSPLTATSETHPEKLDDLRIALSQDQYFSYWAYPGGHYEINDDTWGLFVLAKTDNASVIADVEMALLESGKFAKEQVDFEQYR